MLQPPPSIHNVLFATDFSPATAVAFSYSVGIANRYQSKLIVAHVVSLDSVELLDDEPARAMIDNTRNEATRRISDLLEPLHLPRDRYEIAVAEGEIYEALVEIIQRHHIDIAVLGTHGRRAFKKLEFLSIIQADAPRAYVTLSSFEGSPDSFVTICLFVRQ